MDIRVFVCFFGHATQLVGFFVPRPGIEPGPLAVRTWSPNQQTAREVPDIIVAERSREEVSIAQAVGSHTQRLVRTETSSISLALSPQLNPLPIP